jgi:hypothetical protein
MRGRGMAGVLVWQDFSEVQGKQHLRRPATLHITKSTQTHAQ